VRSEDDEPFGCEIPELWGAKLGSCGVAVFVDEAAETVAPFDRS
jgi:hypothetical protein